MSAPTSVTKQPGHSGSVAGLVLSIFALFSSATGYALIHAKFKNAPSTATNVVDKAVEKGTTAAANGTGHVVLDLIAVPFLVFGIVLAILAVVLIALRMRKVRVGGLLLSLVGMGLALWGFLLAVNTFNVIKAH
jgi:protein-S-isoprenylcysteine O-methyltransferase Ste14